MDKITHQIREEHWARILNECMNSGMSKTAWCRANGISVKQFFYWQRILRREAAGADDAGLRIPFAGQVFASFGDSRQFEMRIRADKRGMKYLS